MLDRLRQPWSDQRAELVLGALAALLAKAYIMQFPHRVKLKLAQGGSDIGVADVSAGRVTIGNS